MSPGPPPPPPPPAPPHPQSAMKPPRNPASGSAAKPPGARRVSWDPNIQGGGAGAGLPNAPKRVSLPNAPTQPFAQSQPQQATQQTQPGYNILHNQNIPLNQSFGPTKPPELAGQVQPTLQAGQYFAPSQLAQAFQQNQPGHNVIQNQNIPLNQSFGPTKPPQLAGQMQPALQAGQYFGPTLTPQPVLQNQSSQSAAPDQPVILGQAPSTPAAQIQALGARSIVNYLMQSPASTQYPPQGRVSTGSGRRPSGGAILPVTLNKPSGLSMTWDISSADKDSDFWNIAQSFYGCDGWTRNLPAGQVRLAVYLVYFEAGYTRTPHWRRFQQPEPINVNESMLKDLGRQSPNGRWYMVRQIDHIRLMDPLSPQALRYVEIDTSIFDFAYLYRSLVSGVRRLHPRNPDLADEKSTSFAFLGESQFHLPTPPLPMEFVIPMEDPFAFVRKTLWLMEEPNIFVWRWGSNPRVGGQPATLQHQPPEPLALAPPDYKFEEVLTELATLRKVVDTARTCFSGTCGNYGALDIPHKITDAVDLGYVFWNHWYDWHSHAGDGGGEDTNPPLACHKDFCHAKLHLMALSQQVEHAQMHQDMENAAALASSLHPPQPLADPGLGPSGPSQAPQTVGPGNDGGSTGNAPSRSGGDGNNTAQTAPAPGATSSSSQGNNNPADGESDDDDDDAAATRDPGLLHPDLKPIAIRMMKEAEATGEGYDDSTDALRPFYGTHLLKVCNVCLQFCKSYDLARLHFDKCGTAPWNFVTKKAKDEETPEDTPFDNRWHGPPRPRSAIRAQSKRKRAPEKDRAEKKTKRQSGYGNQGGDGKRVAGASAPVRRSGRNQGR